MALSKDFPDMTFRFLLVGKTGSGKSSTGNSILNIKKFSSRISFKSVTAMPTFFRETVGDADITIMDAPGFYDNQLKEKDVALMLVKAVFFFHPDLTAFLYVIRVNRYEEKDFIAYLRLKELFGNDISKYMIVVFTGGDDLERDEVTIDDVLDDAPPTLQEVLEDCGKRFVVFNNLADDKGPQRNSLLQKVRMMLAANGNVPYSCPRYATPGMKLHEEVNRIFLEADQRDLRNHPFVQELQQRQREFEEDSKRRDEEYKELVRQRENEAALNAFKEEEIRTQKRKLKELEEKIKDLGLQRQHDQVEKEKMESSHQAEIKELTRKMMEEGGEKFDERIKRVISSEIDHRDRNQALLHVLDAGLTVGTSLLQSFLHQKMLKDTPSTSYRKFPDVLNCARSEYMICASGVHCASDRLAKASDMGQFDTHFKKKSSSRRTHLQ